VKAVQSNPVFDYTTVRAAFLMLALATIGCSGRALPISDIPVAGPDGGVVPTDLAVALADAGIALDLSRMIDTGPNADPSHPDLSLVSVDMTTNAAAPCLKNENVLYLNGDSGD
jgi:hypothetical protein